MHRTLPTERVGLLAFTQETPHPQASLQPSAQAHATRCCKPAVPVDPPTTLATEVATLNAAYVDVVLSTLLDAQVYTPWSQTCRGDLAGPCVANQDEPSPRIA